MPNVIIKPVATGREKKLFLTFPWTLYRGDPNWIPPLRDNVKELVGYKPHPFYEVNRVQTFLAFRDGVVCGRIAAVLNQWHIDRHHERRGFFGFFECIDDQQVANGLFEAVRQWFAERDVQRLRGPANPSLNYEVALLVDGFDSPPTFMMTYNPPYYARLIEGFGFRKVQDMYAYGGTIDMLPAIEKRLAPISEQIIEHLGLRLRPLDRKRFIADVEAFLDVYNKSMSGTWGFVPMSAAEVRHTAKSLKLMMIPELAVAAEINGKMIGAVFGLPDYNPRIKLIDGRLFPFGFIRLLWRKDKIKKIRLLSTNVLPEYQLQGVGLALMHGIMPQAKSSGLQEAEFSWVLESNDFSRGALEKGGARRIKTYRVYDFDPES